MVDHLARNAETGHEHSCPTLDDIDNALLDLLWNRGQQINTKRLFREFPNASDFFGQFTVAHR